MYSHVKKALSYPYQVLLEVHFAKIFFTRIKMKPHWAIGLRRATLQYHSSVAIVCKQKREIIEYFPRKRQPFFLMIKRLFCKKKKIIVSIWSSMIRSKSDGAIHQ